jgi:hypothetical protein
MRYAKKLLCSFLFVILFYNCANAQATKSNSFYDELKRYDLSKVFNPDSIIDDGNEKFKRPEPLGYIDPNYQRFQIHFISIGKDNSNPYVYNITGKTKVKDYICNFTGTITVDEATYDTSGLMNDIGFPEYRAGLITAIVIIEEYKMQPGSGIIKGKIKTDIYFDAKKDIHYSALMLIADGFFNNQIEATWTSYKTGKSKTCNWGDFRIPNSGDLDIGSGEFAVNSKYKENGWISYNPERLETEWWKKN